MKRTLLCALSALMVLSTLLLTSCSDDDHPQRKYNAECILTFDANGAEDAMPVQVFEDGKRAPINVNTMVWPGYTFEGWNTEADGSGKRYTDQESIAISVDETLYAEWIVLSHTITFDPNGADNAMDAQKVAQGESTAKLNANTLTYAGHVFRGWNTEADGSGKTYSDAAEITLTGDITLYAQWAKGVPIALNTSAGVNSMTISLADGIYSVTTTGPDPYTSSMDFTLPAGMNEICFEYISTTGVADFQLFLSPYSGPTNVPCGNIAASTTWATFTFDLTAALAQHNWSSGSFRFDFGQDAGSQIALRNIHMREK